MRTKEYNVYKFEELSKEAKQKAIDKWYDDEDYPMLENDLMESLKAILEEKGIKYSDIAIGCSLSNSQGDGFHFEGSFVWDKKIVHIKHTGRYSHSYTVSFTFEDIDKWYDEGNEIANDKSITKEYHSICKELEKEGYGILEYRMNFEEFAEHCEANEYEFTEDGILD